MGVLRRLTQALVRVLILASLIPVRVPVPVPVRDPVCVGILAKTWADDASVICSDFNGSGGRLSALRVLASTFRNVEHDGRRCTRQLVAQMTAPPWQRFEHLVREHQEIKGQAVHVQAFMIECHARLSAASHRCCRRSRTGTGTGTRTGNIGTDPGLVRGAAEPFDHLGS